MTGTEKTKVVRVRIGEHHTTWDFPSAARGMGFPQHPQQVFRAMLSEGVFTETPGQWKYIGDWMLMHGEERDGFFMINIKHKSTRKYNTIVIDMERGQA
jgi:hypothetical protein